MKQGNVGDCYLLATIDSIANGSREGYQFIKSMFKETDKGVYLRVPHNPLRKHVEDKKQEGKLDGKYEHYYEFSSGKDVFFIPNESLDRIDTDSRGVKTNALAVKILERIITYYYETNVKAASDSNGNDQFDDSLVGHESDQRYSSTSTQFVGHFLGVQIVDLTVDDIHKVIKFKSFRPDYPTYMSIQQSYVDTLGQLVQGRHGLRLVKIIPSTMTSAGGYDFIYANPHNNEVLWQYSYSSIVALAPRFCFFNLNPQDNELVNTLIMLDSNSDSVLTDIEVFDVPEYFRNVLGAAISEKTTTEGNAAKQMVLGGLASYYITDNATYITSAGGLRDSFRNGRFNKELIEKILPPSALLFTALTFMLMPSTAANNFISSFDAPLKDIFIRLMLGIIPNVSPESLFHTIFDISRINRKLGKSLFLLAKDNLPSLFEPKLSFYALFQKVLVEDYNTFKAWFMANSEPGKLGKQDLEVFIEEMLRDIQACNTCFSGCKNTVEVKKLQTRLLVRLQYLPSEYNTRTNFAYPLLIEQISTAYNNKIAEINKNALEHERVLERINEAYIKSIHLDNFCFVISDKTEELRSNGFESMAYTVFLMNKQITTAKKVFLIDGNKEHFSKTCSDVMKEVLRSLEDPKLYNQSFDSLIGDIKLYARQFNITLVDRESIGLFETARSKVFNTHKLGNTNVCEKGPGF